VAGCCECGDEPSGSGAKQLVSSVKNGKCIVVYLSVLKRLYKFYQYSQKRMWELNPVAESLEFGIKKFQ
jgi:hypothetical protein